ncbi:unnamed protein product [Bathycoccus prasinos]
MGAPINEEVGPMEQVFRIPRTGEIIKGTEIYLTRDAEAMALARLRQLAAHEVTGTNKLSNMAIKFLKMRERGFHPYAISGIMEQTPLEN